ncbi:MAG: metallopeptidase TldD-related protein [Candidatus Obscuribacterales bacterium]
MRRAATVTVTLIMLLLPGLSATAGGAVDDVRLRAMSDELQRSLTSLSLPDHEKPYYIRYSLYETIDFSVDAKLGAVSSRSGSRQRTLDVDVKVGSYQSDSSNFKDSSGSGTGITSDAEVGVDDDYMGIRRSFWLATDSAYKKAVAARDAKKAHYLQKKESDHLDDFSRAPAIEVIQEPGRLAPDADRISQRETWTERVRDLSGVFRDFPRVRSSWVRYDERVINTWLVNSEGSRARTAERACRVMVAACCQADDGSPSTDQLVFLAHDRNDLPSREEMMDRTRELASTLTRLANAPAARTYEGPVIFEEEAAASFISSILAPSIKAHRAVPSDTMSDTSLENPLEKKIGLRIMPTFLSVTDDPTARTFRGIPLMGGYDVDDEGVLARPVKVVENGFLRTFLSGRTPSKTNKESNGHGTTTGEAKTSVLILDSSRSIGEGKLERRLRKLARESGFDHAVIVSKLDNLYQINFFDELSSWSDALSIAAGKLPSPAVMYEVSLKDGKRKLVRGATFGASTMRILKDILATGGDARVYAVETAANNYGHVIAPSLLVQEVEILEAENSIKPPELPNPIP